MSLPWVAFYMGDYLKKTKDLTLDQHGAYLLLLIECWSKGRIPKQNEQMICRILGIPASRYRRTFASMVERYFNADGTNKRATEEIEKAEKLYEKRALAGRKGGYKSGFTRRSKRSKREANGEANASRDSEARLNQSERNITTTTSVAAREAAAVENKRPPRKEAKEEKRLIDQAEYMARVGNK